MVCVLTSATSILSLEGISTEDIVAALEKQLQVWNTRDYLYGQWLSVSCVDQHLVHPRSLEDELKEKLDVKVVSPALKLTRSEDEWSGESDSLGTGCSKLEKLYLPHSHH